MVVVGSQAILGPLALPPEDLTQSNELDIYPDEHPEKADLIDGSIGELSPFHNTFGYYAHGVGPETARFPRNWRARAMTVSNANTQGVEGTFPSLADLAISKLAAGRPKDLDFVRAMLRHRVVEASEIESLLSELDEPWMTVTRSHLRVCERP
ncbi:MAG: hypothetical protein FJX76_12820 [Armatimonadetes bacterium]|nr:hypothetical protein [Armatimonadota bacterium]